jgi:hypothetical protein
LRTISGVNEVRKETAATTEKRRVVRGDRYEWALGKTSANQRKVTGMREADANANLAHKYPRSDPAYKETRPLLNVHAATAYEKKAK